jgi:hypothetical protein
MDTIALVYTVTARMTKHVERTSRNFLQRRLILFGACVEKERSVVFAVIQHRVRPVMDYGYEGKKF